MLERDWALQWLDPSIDRLANVNPDFPHLPCPGGKGISVLGPQKNGRPSMPGAPEEQGIGRKPDLQDQL
jgi:hypothetical protein